MTSKEYLGCFIGPRTVDLLLTGECQMGCVCFRPSVSASRESLSLNEWKGIITRCHSVGTRQVVFSGGEPLLFEGLSQLLEYTKSLGLRTTLSTNAILFEELHQEIMPFVDEIGIPLDGPTPEINGLMRPPVELDQFQEAIKAIKTTQGLYPHVELTVRTVVSAANWKVMESIPDLLEREGVLKGSYRWKLYQFNPAVPGALMNRAKNLLLSTEDFLSVWSNLQAKYTGLPHWFLFFPVAATVENNFLVYPNGEALILGQPAQTQGENNLLPSLQYVRLGNLATGFDEAMAAWHQRAKT